MRATPRAATGILRRMGSRLREELRDAERDNLEEGARIARRLSSGPYSSRDLAAMGHPYRRGGSPPADPAIINRQTGVFLRSWRTEGPKGTAGAFSSRIVNRAPYAGFLHRGTRKMIRRPIAERVLQILRPYRLRRLREALSRALTPR